MKNLLALAIVLLITQFVYSQESFLPKKSKYFGVSVKQTKGTLQPKITSLEESKITNVELGINYNQEIRNGFGFQLGLSLQYATFSSKQEKEIINRNPNNEKTVVNIDQLEMQSSFATTSYHVETLVVLTEKPADVLDGEAIKLNLYAINGYGQIGLPISLYKTFGRKKMKFYTQLGLTSKIIIGKRIGSGAFPNIKKNIEVNDKRKFYELEQNGVIYQATRIAATEISREVTNWNIKDFMLNSELEIGIDHESKKARLRLGLLYERTLSNYSVVNSQKYQLNYIGAKIALQRKIKKRSEISKIKT